jgi:protein N-terminal glutamine amidohydrolase
MDTDDTYWRQLQQQEPSAATTALLSASDHDLRVPYYCEENVWRLAYRKTRQQQQQPDTTLSSLSSSSSYFVVFISNACRNVPMFHQRASVAAHVACCWDYHVVLVGVAAPSTTATTNEVVVYDLDSVLPYPCPLADYLQRSFMATRTSVVSLLSPRFRIVSAKQFLQHFSSDRRHMFNTQTQTWNAPRPLYACILTTTTATTTSSSSTTAGTSRQDLTGGGNVQTSASTLLASIPTTSTAATTMNANHHHHYNLEAYLDFSQEEPPDGKADMYGVILTLEQLHDYFLDETKGIQKEKSFITRSLVACYSIQPA